MKIEEQIDEQDNLFENFRDVIEQCNQKLTLNLKFEEILRSVKIIDKNNQNITASSENLEESMSLSEEEEKTNRKIDVSDIKKNLMSSQILASPLKRNNSFIKNGVSVDLRKQSESRGRNSKQSQPNTQYFSGFKYHDQSNEIFGKNSSSNSNLKMRPARSQTFMVSSQGIDNMKSLSKRSKKKQYLQSLNLNHKNSEIKQKNEKIGRTEFLEIIQQAISKTFIERITFRNCTFQTDIFKLLREVFAKSARHPLTIDLRGNDIMMQKYSRDIKYLAQRNIKIKI